MTANQALRVQLPAPNPASIATSDRLVSDCLVALARWNPSPTLPTGTSSNTLAEAIEAQRDKLATAAERDITNAAASLLTHAAATGIRVDDPIALKAVWAVHCRDMPACLLATGLAEVLKHWTNTFCLPAPGAVWDHIEPELVRMRRDLAIMQNARAATDDDVIDPADRTLSSETEAVMQRTLAHLRSASGNRRRVA